MRRVLLSLTLALAACSHDWESLDPRGASSGASAGASGSGGAVAAGSSSSASSGSGASGAAGPGGAGTGGSAGSGQGGAATGGAGGAGGEGGSVPVTMAFAPTVAECVSTNAPDPVECETKTGKGLMNVDLLDPMMLERRAFLRFEIDAQLAASPVDSIVLQLTTGPGMGNSSSQAGDVYQVETFTLAELTGTVPATVGPVLAGSPGAVAIAAQASWTLPSDLLAGTGGVLCLGVLPLVSDGADYFNLDGTTPPALVVTFH